MVLRACVHACVRACVHFTGLGFFMHCAGTMAKNCGLNVSFLERLSKRTVYCRDSITGNFNSNLIVKLVRNYRSHPELITVSNSLFYEKELVACASSSTHSIADTWDALPAKGVPLIFWGVEGNDEREHNSPSW